MTMQFYNWDHLFPTKLTFESPLKTAYEGKQCRHGTPQGIPCDYLYCPQDTTRWNDPAHHHLDRAMRNSPVQCPDLDQEPPHPDEERCKHRDALDCFMCSSTPAQSYKEPQPIDVVRHPEHYQGDGFEVIDVIECFNLSYNLGNVIKYVLRHPNKGGSEDLRKALNYLCREVTGEWFSG